MSLASRPLVLVLVMAALSLVPFALLMVTSFVRISVVLSILRSAIGTPSVPPTPVLTGLALVLTLAVMSPTGERMYAAAGPALGAAVASDLASAEAITTLGDVAVRAREPLRDFLVKHADPPARASFHALTLKLRTPGERAAVTGRDGEVACEGTHPREGHRQLAPEPRPRHAAVLRERGRSGLACGDEIRGRGKSRREQPA